MRVFLVLPLISGAAAFAGVQRHPRAPGISISGLRSKTSSGATLQRLPVLLCSVDDETTSYETDSPVKRPSFSSLIPTLATSALAWAATAQAALADSPDWGLFEGRTGSLLHPIMMGSLLLYSIYTGLLGFQWRRQRTIGDEIKALQKSLPDLQGAATVQEAIAAARSAEEPQASRISLLQDALTVEQQIKELQKERKSLVEAGPRDKHYSQGTLLAFLGTAFAIEGPLNTFARAGKLFPGPHLYSGAGLVVLWALAAACVPAMQKGSDTARTVHIGANLIGLGLFGWQVVSGIPILLKVIENTTWP